MEGLAYPGNFHCDRAHVTMDRWLAQAGTPRIELNEHIMPRPPLCTQLSNCGRNVVACGLARASVATADNVRQVHQLLGADFLLGRGRCIYQQQHAGLCQ